MKEPRLQQLPESALDADVHKVDDVEARSRHGRLVRELHPVDPLHAQHAPRGVRPHDSGRPDARHIAVQLLRTESRNLGLLGALDCTFSMACLPVEGSAQLVHAACSFQWCRTSVMHFTNHCLMLFLQVWLCYRGSMARHTWKRSAFRPSWM